MTEQKELPKLSSAQMRDYIIRAHGLATGNYVQDDTEMRRRVGTLLEKAIQEDVVMTGFLGRGGPRADRDILAGNTSLDDVQPAEDERVKKIRERTPPSDRYTSLGSSESQPCKSVDKHGMHTMCAHVRNYLEQADEDRRYLLWTQSLLTRIAAEAATQGRRDAYNPERIKPLLDDAHKVGQIVGIERAAEVCGKRVHAYLNELHETLNTPAACPEGQDDFTREIRALSPDPSYLDRVRNEAIADLENRAHQTVFFECGCVFKQDGLDAEPSFKYCNGHDVAAALERATQVIKNRRSWYGEEFFGPMPSMENATESEKRLVTLASANMARHTCDHLLTEIAAIGDDKEQR